MDHHDAFAENYLVHGLPREVVEEIEGLATYQTFVARDVLLRMGEKSSDLYVILEGRVQILTEGGELLAEIGPPNVIGEVSLVDDQPRSANAVCLGVVKVARLPAKDLRSYMAKNPAAGFPMLSNLARVLSMRLRKADATVESLAANPKDAWAHAL